jgi:hypothetical protein
MVRWPMRQRLTRRITEPRHTYTSPERVPATPHQDGFESDFRSCPSAHIARSFYAVFTILIYPSKSGLAQRLERRSLDILAARIPTKHVEP